jgi:hypothetical protein
MQAIAITRTIRVQHPEGQAHECPPPIVHLSPNPNQKLIHIDKAIAVSI